MDVNNSPQNNFKLLTFTKTHIKFCVYVYNSRKDWLLFEEAKKKKYATHKTAYYVK